MNEKMQKIIELRNQGVPTRGIAKEIGISLNYVRTTIDRMIKLGYISKFSEKEVRDRYMNAVALRKSKRPSPQTIIELYQQGLTKKEISEKLNLGKHFVWDILKDICQQKSYLFKTKLIEMYEAGIPCKEMAEQLNCSEAKVSVSVHRLVKQGKLKLRKQFRHRKAATTVLPRISEAAKQLGVYVDTLRRWEAEGLIVPIRTPNGKRRYDIEAIKRQLEAANGNL